MTSLPDSILVKLRPWQHDPASHLLGVLKKYGSAVDLSDTGVGKTYVACAVMAALQLPTLVICPKIAISMWHRVAAHFGEKISVTNYENIRTGKTLFGTWQHPKEKEEEEEEILHCQCCQQTVSFAAGRYRSCHCHHAGVHCVTIKKQRHSYGNFNFDPAIRAVIFDEVHRCGGMRSLNAELLIGAKRQQISALALSATAACNPLQMRALGYCFDLHTLTPAGGAFGFYQWAARYGCRRDVRFQGFKWLVGEARQREVMREIRGRIIPSRGVRVRCADIPGFPESDIIAELYDLEENNGIDVLYAEMAAALSLVDAAAASDVNSNHPLTIILRARQRIELLKVPIAESLANDYLAKGYSVAIFANFRGTISELGRRLDTNAIIDGSPAGVAHRQKHIDRFQENAIRVILANSEAGGCSVSLHDLRGDSPRVGLVFPSFSAVTMRQVFGRLRRDGGRSRSHYRVLFAANTCECRIAAALRAKSNNLDSLNDADMMPENFRLHKQSTKGQ